MGRNVPGIRRVPELTIWFWVIKLLTTGMGETTSDFLVRTINPVVAVVLGGFAFVLAMALQLSAGRYVAWRYWFAVAMVAVFGTMAADVLHIVIGIPYLVSTTFFSVALVVVFASWRTREGTLSIHSVDTRSRELFYWATVLTTFALGTAAGDMTAITLGLGYLASGVLFAVLIAAPAVAYRFAGLDAIVAFWFAYIVTRPLGASFADWAGRPRSLGGLAIGTGLVSLVLAIVIVAIVAGLTISDRDRERQAA